MLRSELMARLVSRMPHVESDRVEQSVLTILRSMAQSLTDGGRIEIRDFGSFAPHRRDARNGRNPKTGDAVNIPPKVVVRFKAGKALRERV
ncbi:MAG: HU family DNA-binding protein [Proteobacteria bacterium]|nr:HU family DNA-binding protein [Pseudomonadota bacterium]MBS0370586.1 HU family DNA-binding protein [Pseudomonadota bacterium]